MTNVQHYRHDSLEEPDFDMHIPVPPEFLQQNDVEQMGRSVCGGRLCKRILSVACNPLSACVFLVSYALLGAFLYMITEGRSEQERLHALSVLRRNTVEKLWDITVTLNILYKENWTALVSHEIQEFQKILSASMNYRYKDADLKDFPQWNFSGCFLYALTMISTVGFGKRSPKTVVGKLLTIAYIFGGIPLLILYLSCTGRMMAKCTRVAYSRLHCSCSRQQMDKWERNRFPATTVTYLDHNICSNHVAEGVVGNTIKRDRPNLHIQKIINVQRCEDEETSIPISVCLVLLISYICVGAALFSSWEKWNFLDSLFFCIVSLSTVGFGDMFPGEGLGSNTEVQIAFIFCAMYLLTGMSIISMCFILIRENITKKLNACFKKQTIAVCDYSR